MNRKPLKAGKPLAPISERRLAKLAAQGIHHPTSTLVARKPAKAATQRRQGSDPDAATVELVLERDRFHCVGCGEPLHGQRGLDYSIHHRKLRSAGVDNSPANLISLCGHGTSGCHGSAHAEVAASRLSGLLLLSTDQPDQVAVEHAVHGLVRLLGDGSILKGVIA